METLIINTPNFNEMKNIIAWFNRNKKRNALESEMESLKKELMGLAHMSPHFNHYRFDIGDKIIERIGYIENEMKKL